MQTTLSENKVLKKTSSNLEEFYSLDALQAEIEIIGTETISLLGKTLYKIEMRYNKKLIFYCSRRYNDFYALHKVLKIRFGLIDWPKFPSKSDIFNKIENRKLGFTALLQTMLKATIQHKSIRENILKLLYNFLTKDLSGKEQATQSQPIQVTINEKTQSKQIDEEDDFEYSKQLMRQLDQDISESFNLVSSFASSDNQNNTTFFESQSLSSFLFEDQQEIRKRTPHLLQPKNSQVYEEPEYVKKLGFDQNSKFDYKKEIENYGDYILLRFSEDEIYKQFYSKIEKSNLLLFSQINVQQDSFSCQICLHQASIKLYPDRIEIYHELDFKKMQITVEGEVPSRRQENNFLRTFDHKIKVLYNQLKFAIQKPPITLPEYLNEDFSPVGKIQIHSIKIIKQNKNFQVKEARNLVNLPLNSLIQCRIKFSPFLCKTKVHMRTENPQWRQDFIIPVNDSYGSIVLEIVLLINDGVFSKHQKEQVIGYAELLMADILSYHSDTRSKLFNLQLTPTGETVPQRIGLLTKLQKQNTLSDIETEKPYVTLSIRNLSSIYSIFASPSIQSFEGEKQEPDFNLFKLSIVRFKRIIGLLGLLSVYMDDIMDQKYPKLTKLFFTTIFVFAIFVDMNNLLYYISIFFLAIFAYHSPYLKPIITKILDEQIFDEINPTYLKPRIFTEEEYELSMKCQSLDKYIKFEGNNLKFEDNEEDEKDQEGLLQKLRVMKKQFFVLQVQLTWISNGFEKIFNLITWQEPQRTFYVFTLFLIICFVIRILPIRLIIMAGLINEWFDGKLAYTKRYNHNYELSKAVIEYIYTKFFPEYMKNIEYLKQEWPNNPQSKNKILEEIRLHLKLHITQEEFNTYKTPISLIEAIKTCQQRLRINRIIDNTFERDQLYYKLRQCGKKRVKPHILLFYTISNFCYNIPSDYYRIKYPKKIYYQ